MPDILHEKGKLTRCYTLLLTKSIHSSVSISDNQTPPSPKKKEEKKTKRDDKNMQAI